MAVVKYYDEQTLDWVPLPGTQGAIGPTGPTGPTGTTGPTGDTGAEGPVANFILLQVLS